VHVLVKYADLKLPVSGRSKQESKQTYTHTHVHNELTLVWGSLRLAPISKESELWRSWLLLGQHSSVPLCRNGSHAGNIHNAFNSTNMVSLKTIIVR